MSVNRVSTNQSSLDTVERGIASLPHLVGEGVQRRVSALLKRPAPRPHTSDTVRGAIAILTGVAAVAFPRASLTTLITVFGVYAAVDATLAVATAARTHTHRFRLLTQAGVDVGAILAAIAYPDVTNSAALTLLALWIVLMGALRVRDAVDFAGGIHVNVLVVLLALPAVYAGVNALAAPEDNLAIITLNVWIFTILHGVMLIAHGRRTTPDGDLTPAPSLQEPRP
jgi:uncharacterized membrane protein HdeD (DUF308 family)